MSRDEMHTSKIKARLRWAIQERSRDCESWTKEYCQLVREFLALVGDAQRVLREEVPSGTLARDTSPAGTSSHPLRLSSRDQEEARRVFLEQQRLAKSWKEAAIRESREQDGAGICRPTEAFLQRLALNEDAVLMDISRVFEAAGMNISYQRSLVCIVFPDGIEAFWSLCQDGERIESRVALDTAISSSVLGLHDSEETLKRARQELFVFLDQVAASLIWH